MILTWIGANTCGNIIAPPIPAVPGAPIRDSG
jgi:hypothetical protein